MRDKLADLLLGCAVVVTVFFLSAIAAGVWLNIALSWAAL